MIASAPSTSAAAELPLREFRPAAEYCRCLLYLPMGGCAIVRLFLFLPRPANAPPLGLAATGAAAIFVVLPLLVRLYLATWQLRVDHHGVWRRRLGRWTCWTWEFLVDQRVRFDRRHSFLWSGNRPWHDRLLGFAVLAPPDAAFVLEVIERVRKACTAEIPPPELAEVKHVAIRTTQWIRLDIDRFGLAIKSGPCAGEYPWDSVSEFRVERWEQQQAVVHRFRIRLAAGATVRSDLLFTWLDGVQDWTPHKKDRAWFVALRSLVPASKWKCLQTWDTPQSREEAEFRLVHYAEHQRLARWLGRIFLPLLAGMGAWVFVPRVVAAANDPFLPLGWKIVTLVCMTLTMIQPTFITWALVRHIIGIHQKKLAETRTQLTEAGF
jgi:hypothetical protein